MLQLIAPDEIFFLNFLREKEKIIPPNQSMSSTQTETEVLLKKRKNDEVARMEKAESLRQAEEERQIQKRKKQNTFVPPEYLALRHLASEREQHRIDRVLKVEKELKQKAISSDKTQQEQDQGKLVFVVRVQGPKRAHLPQQVDLILKLLRLTEMNTGVFVRETSSVIPLLKVIRAHVVIGEPSLYTVRSLVQKRAKITIEGENGPRSVELNDNNVIEDKLGDYGIVCMEDIIHEIFSLEENFKVVNKFLNPFQLSPPESGWGPESKLRKLVAEESKSKVSNSGRAELEYVDIDKYIEEQN
ncbi:uncharacterized protein PAS_chr3_0038 [Komagataella phaffii GS115]|uniref:Nucleolar protein with similarity to large ribosomal subunit L7 proteins n=2 Tax=Komagataella phaffii TaxID=460519 RepID=C4R3C9_KOMPG|nr:uncharacterized protein PAS_chr3_0038 [Komagataella phaffii GS115]AOA64274.1 GQ67_03047T0 [Komagataella phaffii]AOA69322.1 GQ68_03032T0 [Komagataella phaffii GS115]CAY69964.1 Nucleolar protein with similarity to large ribosomal subunit L7 proteins [Komagataella phaffii GS115]